MDWNVIVLDGLTVDVQVSATVCQTLDGSNSEQIQLGESRQSRTFQGSFVPASDAHLLELCQGDASLADLSEVVFELDNASSWFTQRQIEIVTIHGPGITNVPALSALHNHPPLPHGCFAQIDNSAAALPRLLDHGPELGGHSKTDQAFRCESLAEQLDVWLEGGNADMADILQVHAGKYRELQQRVRALHDFCKHIIKEQRQDRRSSVENATPIANAHHGEIEASEQDDKTRATIGAMPVQKSWAGDLSMLAKNGDSDGVEATLRAMRASCSQQDIAQEIVSCEFGERNVESALHCAALRGRVEILYMLLAAKAPVNAADDAGNTPLLLAIAQGHATAARALLDAGASTNIANNFCSSPETNSKINSWDSDSVSEGKKIIQGMLNGFTDPWDTPLPPDEVECGSANCTVDLS